jgi:integrase/recombinase XerD
MRKGIRKHGRVSPVRNVTETFTMSEMFERFMWFKQSEGLASRTIEEYRVHFQGLLVYLGQDLTREQMTLEVFLEWVDFVLNDKGFNLQQSIFVLEQ